MVEVDATGKTTFRFRHATDAQVFLVGDWCHWQTDHLPMRKVSDHEWVLMMRLPPGVYEFRYYAGDRWFSDCAAFGMVLNEMGDWNSVVRVPKHQAAAAPEVRRRVRIRQADMRRLARSA